MASKRCINCQSTVAAFVEAHLGGYRYQPLPEAFRTENYFLSYDPTEMEGTFYRFVKAHDEGSFAHFQIQRGFCEGRIYLRIDNVIVHYQQYLWNFRPCTGRIFSNANHVGAADRVPPAYQIRSLWFDCDNTKEGLVNALEQLRGWYEEHQEAFAVSLAKQLFWINKEDRSIKVIANFVREHAAQLDDVQVREIYMRVDELLTEYLAAYPDERKKPISEQVIFYEYCNGKLPTVLGEWIAQLEQPLQKAKVKFLAEPWHVIYVLLVFFHDSQKLRDPALFREKQEEPEGYKPFEKVHTR